jgi:hypothetical protein
MIVVEETFVKSDKTEWFGLQAHLLCRGLTGFLFHFLFPSLTEVVATLGRFQDQYQSVADIDQSRPLQYAQKKPFGDASIGACVWYCQTDSVFLRMQISPLYSMHRPLA